MGIYIWLVAKNFDIVEVVQQISGISMQIIEQLFAQYSIESILLLLIMLGVSVKFIGELCEYFYNKMKKYFADEASQTKENESLSESIRQIDSKVTAVKDSIEKQQEIIAMLQEQSQLTVERMQENERSYIIDKHHYFCYEVGMIDDMNLQSLERRYVYYKAQGGNSFIDGLMREIRALPRTRLIKQGGAADGPATQGDDD